MPSDPHSILLAYSATGCCTGHLVLVSSANYAENRFGFARKQHSIELPDCKAVAVTIRIVAVISQQYTRTVELDEQDRETSSPQRDTTCPDDYLYATHPPNDYLYATHAQMNAGMQKQILLQITSPTHHDRCCSDDENITIYCPNLSQTLH